MSVRILREQGLPGLTMRYEEGGAVQVYEMDGREVRLGPDASIDEIKAALLAPPPSLILTET